MIPSRLADSGFPIALAFLQAITIRKRHNKSMSEVVSKLLMTCTIPLCAGLFLAVYRKAPLAVDMYDGRQEAPAAASHQTFLNKTFLFGRYALVLPSLSLHLRYRSFLFSETSLC